MKCKILTRNKIYGKTPYVQVQILSKPWKFYTIQDGVDGDILQVWLEVFPSLTQSDRLVSLLEDISKNLSC